MAAASYTTSRDTTVATPGKPPIHCFTRLWWALEEQEIVVKIIGEGASRRLLFGESAEGGIGVA